ncbi:CLUMA_CG008908, isoform A [Clunio marinus]|uniref:CLUMA_CG008908, isoform A n=1 Tax=Clunio marinus TaxID=568069 RepID=A0A1J1I6G2_9DIPT|nr:CLUMA_CG008908, isoform A [Clunio marinus]
MSSEEAYYNLNLNNLKNIPLLVPGAMLGQGTREMHIQPIPAVANNGSANSSHEEQSANTEENSDGK